MHLIPPLYHQSSFVTNFNLKSELFNSIFASKYSLTKNYTKLSSHLNDKTDNPLLTASFSIDDIAKMLQNYLPVSLLPICRKKILKGSFYNEIFEFFIENDLISPNQLGCKPGGSCTNQFLAFINEIYKSFDQSFEVRVVFLDISNTFDKVW